MLTTKRLAECFEVTGVDISERSVELAGRNVPAARFIHADMAELDFPRESYGGVTAFYSVTHLPREEHVGLLRRIASWLRPNGLLVATMGAVAVEGSVEEDWLGAPMYFSHFDGETNKLLVERARLRVTRARDETEEEDGRPVTFLWIVARKV